MHNVLAMTKVKSISNCANDLANLAFSFAANQIFLITELATLHILHHNIEVISIVIDFINLNNVRMI